MADPRHDWSRERGVVGCLYALTSLAIIAAGVGAAAYLLVHFLPAFEGAP